jgi:hypothetical protein
MLTTHRHLAPKFGMSSAASLHPVVAFVAGTGTTLPFLRITCRHMLNLLNANSTAYRCHDLKSTTEKNIMYRSSPWHVSSVIVYHTSDSSL